VRVVPAVRARGKDGGSASSIEIRRREPTGQQPPDARPEPGRRSGETPRVHGRRRAPRPAGLNRGRLLAIVDQLLSAAQNFAVVSLAARQLDAPAFGWFALALTVCWLLFGVNLALVTEPLLVRSGLVAPRGWPRLTGSAITFTVLTSVPLSLGCLVAGFVVPRPLRDPLLAVALVLPVLGVFETVRTAALARLRQGVALSMDAAWVLLWIAVLLLTHPRTAAAHLLIWGLTSAIGLVVYCVRHRSELGRLRRGLRDHAFAEFSRGLKRLYLFEYLSTGGLAHLFTMCLSGVVGIIALGGYRAAQAVTGPFNTVLNALRMVVVPLFSRASSAAGERGRGLPQRYPAGLSGLLVAVVLVLTGGLLLMPQSLGLALFGVTWSAAAPLVLAVSLQRAAAAALMGPITALRVSDAAGKTVRLRVISAAIGYLVALLIGVRWGLVQALWALVLISAVETAVAWWIWLGFDPALADRDSKAAR
jgi:O-antigen/teichoic acid export membrane protein